MGDFFQLGDGTLPKKRYKLTNSLQNYIVKKNHIGSAVSKILQSYYFYFRMYIVLFIPLKHFKNILLHFLENVQFCKMSLPVKKLRSLYFQDAKHLYFRTCINGMYICIYNFYLLSIFYLSSFLFCLSLFLSFFLSLSSSRSLYLSISLLF